MRVFMPFLGKIYPVVKQLETNDCAPAALHSVLKFHKGEVSRYHLQSLCRTGFRGTTMFDLKCAAEKIGFRAIGATGTYDQLRTQTPPFIAHIIDQIKGHYLVVYKMYDRWILAGDPASGLHIISRTRFENIWKNRAVLLLWPTKALPDQRAHRPWIYIKCIIRQERSLIFQSIFLGLINTFAGLFIAFYIQYIIDFLIPSSDLVRLKLATVILVILFLINATGNLLRQRILVYFLYRAGMALNRHFQKHLFHLQKQFFDSIHIGDTIVRINDLVKVPAAVMVILGTIVIDLLLIIAIIGGVFLMNVQIAVVISLILPINLLVVVAYMRKIGRDQQDIIRVNSNLQGKYIEALKGIDDIISYNAQSVFSVDHVRTFKRLQGYLKKLGLHQSALSFSTEVLRTGMTVFILLAGASMVIQSEMMIGQVIACYFLISNIMPVLTRLGETSVSLKGASIAWGRLLDLWQVPTEKLVTGRTFQFFESLRLTGGEFSWNHSKSLWRGININIKRGTLVALTGPSGSGKTTLLHVLQRKYNLMAGKIYLDDQPAALYRLRDYRRRITLVPQDIHIFKGSLLDNILLGRPNWYMNELLEKFPFADWIGRFENGLKTMIGDLNRLLSGGEKQVIALMRALYARPDIILIDEALGSIDPETQQRLLYTLKLFALEGGALICTHDTRIIAQTDQSVYS